VYGSVGGALIRLLPLPDPPSHPRDYHWNERSFEGGHDRYTAIAVATMEAGAPLVLAREQTRREAHVLRARVATLDGLVATVHGMDLLTSLLDGEEPPDAVPTAAIAAGEAAYQRPDVEAIAEAMAKRLAGSDPLRDLRAAMGVHLDALDADGALSALGDLGLDLGSLRAALGGVEGLEGVGRDYVGLKPSQIGYFDPAHLPVPKLPIKGQAKALIEELEKKSMLALLTAYILVGDRAAGCHVSDVVLAIDALVGSGWEIKDAVNAMRQGERAIWNLVATAPGDGNTQMLIEHIWRYVCACESAKRYYPPQVHLEGHVGVLHVQLGIKTLVRLITEGADDEDGWAKIEAGFLKMEQEGGWEITVAVRKMRRGERRATHLLFDADPRSDGLIDIILAAVLAAEGPRRKAQEEEGRRRRQEQRAPLVGKQVLVQGLEAKPELNNRTGTATAWDGERGRYSVRLQDGSLLSFKPANLKEVLGLQELPDPSAGGLVHSLGPTRPHALDDGGDTNLDDIDDAVAVAVQAAQAEEAQAQAQAEAAGERLKGIGAPVIDEMDDTNRARALAPSMLSELETTQTLPFPATSMLPSVSDLPEATLNILKIILRNVIEKPEDLKNRSLSKSNKALCQKLFPHQDAVAFLCACGFEESNEGVHLPDGADLKLVDEALNSVRTALEPAGKPPPAAAAAAKSPTTPRATHPESGATHTIDEEEGVDDGRSSARRLFASRCWFRGWKRSLSSTTGRGRPLPGTASAGGTLCGCRMGACCPSSQPT
jgi:hypothetical protein